MWPWRAERPGGGGGSDVAAALLFAVSAISVELVLFYRIAREFPPDLSLECDIWGIDWTGSGKQIRGVFLLAHNFRSSAA